MKNRYKNLWHDSLNIRKPEYYENNALPIMMHRGVTVFKLWDAAYDFVFADACITQRAGATNAEKVINDILDGEIPVSNVVKNHLIINGEKNVIDYNDAVKMA